MQYIKERNYIPQRRSIGQEPIAKAADSPIDGNHGNAEQGDSDIAVLNERNELAENFPVLPRAFDESEGIEG